MPDVAILEQGQNVMRVFGLCFHAEFWRNRNFQCNVLNWLISASALIHAMSNSCWSFIMSLSSSTRWELTSEFDLTCKCCWENWAQCWAVRDPMKKGGRGASMAESGPGCNNLRVTLRSMGGFPLTAKETCLLMITSTKDGEREAERERNILCCWLCK